MTPTTRALVAAARAGLDPDPGAAARVRAKLDLALAGGGAGAAAGAAASAGAAPVATGGLALKLAAIIAVAGAAAVVAIPSHRSRATAVPAPTVEDPALVETPRTHVVAAAPDTSSAPARVVHHHVAAPAATPAGEVSLSREVELIDRAMGSLRAGHAAEALAAITLYHRETADRGQLTEDASAIEIEASCTLDLDVSTKLAFFDTTWPSSAQRSRLTTACHR